MDAESRWFYAVGLTATLLGGSGLVLRATGATISSRAGWLLVAVFLAGLLAIILGQRKLRERFQSWRARRPQSFPAGWKMPPKGPR